MKKNKLESILLLTIAVLFVMLFEDIISDESNRKIIIYSFIILVVSYVILFHILFCIHLKNKFNKYNGIITQINKNINDNSNIVELIVEFKEENGTNKLLKYNINSDIFLKRNMSVQIYISKSDKNNMKFYLNSCWKNTISVITVSIIFIAIVLYYNSELFLIE